MLLGVKGTLKNVGKRSSSVGWLFKNLTISKSFENQRQLNVSQYSTHICVTDRSR